MTDLLASPDLLAAVKQTGHDVGERDALDSIRLAMVLDDRLPWEAIAYHVNKALWREGVRYEEMGVHDKAAATTAWLDGYRDGYAVVINEQDDETQGEDRDNG